VKSSWMTTMAVPMKRTTNPQKEDILHYPPDPLSDLIRPLLRLPEPPDLYLLNQEVYEQRRNDQGYSIHDESHDPVGPPQVEEDFTRNIVVHKISLYKGLGGL
jgi:hypothetical protein